MAPKQSRIQSHIVQSVKSLRHGLRALKRQQNRSEKSLLSVVPEHVQKMAVLIQILSDDSRWAIAWVQNWQMRMYVRTFGTPPLPTHALILAWVEKHKTDPELLANLAHIENPERIQADVFLIETLLYEFVQENTRKGISIPSSAVLTRYLRLWSYRPVSIAVNTKLLQLQHSARHRKEWCRKFRLRWRILWGLLEKEKPQSHALLQKKVFELVNTSNKTIAF
jgi:hypothetical protein